MKITDTLAQAMQELISDDPNLKAIFARADAEKARIARIEAAAQAVVWRWDNRDWKDAENTAVSINALRDALQQLKETK